MPAMNDILAIILGGGRGSRLFPLTKMRSKPAVPIAGKYRLIDIPISNCINSGIYRIAVLTQFNSVSLHRHITQTYTFDQFHTGWVQIWAAEQTMKGMEWYQGTADAVRKQIHEIRSAHSRYTLILSGDHLYRMDYAKMAEFHWSKKADITVAVQPTSWADVSRFGILKRDEDCRIMDFAEKPKERDKQEAMISRGDPEKPFLASMGIYLFSTELLLDLLTSSTVEDFGNHVIPAAIHTQAVYGFNFEGYWEDIGTIRSFYETNLALTTLNAPFDLYDPVSPLYTHARILPASRVENSRLRDVLLAEGCCIEQADIDHSIIGVRAQIGAGCEIRDSIIMGADYYDFDEPLQRTGVPMGIGAGCIIEGAIVDKNARVGAGTTIRYYPPGTDIDHPLYVVRDGIPVIPKSSIIPAGTYIGPGAPG